MHERVVDTVNSLRMLGGKRWMEDDAVSALLTRADIQVVKSLLSGQFESDKDLVKHLYGRQSGVDARYRRRMGRLANRLSRLVLVITLSASLDKRRDTITSLRHVCVGETLLRTGAPKSSRHHFLEALQSTSYPELVWYAPAMHFAFAYHAAVNRQGPIARHQVKLAQEACDEAMMIGALQGLWVLLTIPTRRAADKRRAEAVVTRAKLLLPQIGKKSITGRVGAMAARLASSVSQYTGEIQLGLQWLERSKKAAKKSGNFHDVAALEYHTQRLFLFNVAHEYEKGISEVIRVISLTQANSTGWFTAMNTLLHLQLKSESYSDARKTADILLAQKGLSKQSKQVAGRVRLRGYYALLLTRVEGLDVRVFNYIKSYPLDVIVLRILWYLQRSRDTEASAAMLSLKRYVDRMEKPRSDYPLWLLSKLLTVYAQQNHNIRECRKVPAFKRYEAKLRLYKVMETDNTVITPLAIWKAISEVHKR